MNGYLLVDKPAGWTSFDVVAKVRGTLKKGGLPAKVGHGGTLDPMATGLLVLLIGDYTKRQDEFMKLDKTYEAVVRLGATSTTDDAEGEITEVSSKEATEKEVEAVPEEFTGKIAQVPPMHSAIKVDGKRAYKLARAGKSVELKSREVTVYEMADIRYDWPDLSFTCTVSSGTYIRSLARDIGRDLGVGGYLTGLRRTSIGPYLVSDAISPETLNTDLIQKHLRSSP